jgi:hypothetical protein
MFRTRGRMRCCAWVVRLGDPGRADGALEIQKLYLWIFHIMRL